MIWQDLRAVREWQGRPTNVVKAVVNEKHRNDGEAEGPIRVILREATLKAVLETAALGEAGNCIYRETSDYNVAGKHTRGRDQP